MKSELVASGETARALPREGTLLRAPPPAKPAHHVSARAKGVWSKLATWYGANKLQDFGPWPPEELCKLIDAVRTRDELGGVLADVKQAHPIWPPTVPQFEAIFRKRQPPTINWAERQCALTDHVFRTRGAAMSTPQRIQIPRWQWYQDGCFVPPGDGAPGFFVPFTEIEGA